MLGPDNPQTLGARANLALWLTKDGQAAAAIPHYRQLVDDRMRVHGPDHPMTLAALGSLADARGRAGDVAAACLEFERVLHAQVDALGPEHPHVAITRRQFQHWQTTGATTGT